MSQNNWTRITFALTTLVVVGAWGAFTLAAEHEDAMHAVKKAVCVLSPTKDNMAKGVVTFTQTDDGVLVEAMVEGLGPNEKHGFHIHQFGDISKADGTGTGGHFNPHGMDHAGPTDKMRHVGDLGNLESDADGKAEYKRVDSTISLDLMAAECILGRGIIVHAGTDDLTSQPTGAAGARIAQGVIGAGSAE